MNSLVEASRLKWDNFTRDYSAVDSGPQSFYFTLVNLLKVTRAKNILQIGSGAGHLLGYTIALKPKDAYYLVTDLSPQMIATANQRLQKFLQSYKSQLTLPQWLQSNKVELRAENGMEVIPAPVQFDVVICNLVLNLVPDPQLMLRSIHKQTTSNARVGLTIWGDKSRDNFLTFSERALKLLGYPPASLSFSGFSLNTRLEECVSKCGWEIKVTWEQAVAYPFVDAEDQDYFMEFQITTYAHLSQEQKQKLCLKLRELYKEQLAQGRPFIMCSQMCILVKKGEL